jgi:hypothetical protein
VCVCVCVCVFVCVCVCVCVRRRVILVGTAIRLRAGHSQIRFPFAAEEEIFLFSKEPILALRHAQTCIQWLLGPLPREIQTWREAARSHLLSNLVEFHNVWSSISTPHMLSWYNGTAGMYNMLVYSSVCVFL